MSDRDCPTDSDIGCVMKNFQFEVDKCEPWLSGLAESMSKRKSDD